MSKLKICHVSMFAPNQCGLYEASRDMAKADILSGNQVYFVDAGKSIDGKCEPGKVGQIDDRSGFKLITANPDLIQDSNIIIMHTGLNDNYIVKSDAPIIWVVHGKPLDCFRPEQNNQGRNSYTLYKSVASWQRSKKMLYFWPEYKPFWDPIFPAEKHLIFDYPVIDNQRFTPNGPKYDIKNPGKYNVLICDSIRADIDTFEATIGCIETAKLNLGIKFHFAADENKQCWKYLFDSLKKYDALGDVLPRITNIADIYRAVDLVFSPNRIVNRIVAESLCCGTHVMQEQGAKLADVCCYVPNPEDVVEGFRLFISQKENGNLEDPLKRAILFNMRNYSEKMNRVYNEILGR
jgi:hypothetical protein